MGCSRPHHKFVGEAPRKFYRCSCPLRDYRSGRDSDAIYSHLSPLARLRHVYAPHLRKRQAADVCWVFFKTEYATQR